MVRRYIETERKRFIEVKRQFEQQQTEFLEMKRQILDRITEDKVQVILLCLFYALIV